MSDDDKVQSDQKGRCILEEVKWNRAIYFPINGSTVQGLRHDTNSVVQIALDYGRREVAVKWKNAQGNYKTRRVPIENVEWYDAFAWKDVPKPPAK